MPKVAKPLTAIEIRRLGEPGLHAVGTVPGLRLRVKPTGTRQWVLRVQIGTRRSELGLGGYTEVTLAAAQQRARELKDRIRVGNGSGG